MDRFEQLAAQFLDNTLSNAEGIELANHLRADPQAARELRMLYAQDRLLVELHRSDDLPAMEAIMAEIRGDETAFVGSVMQRVRKEAQPHGWMVQSHAQGWFWALQRYWLVWAAGAAILAIMLPIFLLCSGVGQPFLLVSDVSSVIVERHGQNVLVADRLILQPNDLITSMGTNIAAISYAPENTRLDLKPGTTVKVLDWSRGKRLELRIGQLEAGVARQRPFRPLRVGTPNAEARVLGTTFTLSATTNSTRLDVREGTVRLIRASDQAAVKVRVGQYALVARGAELTALPETGGLLREVWTGVPGGEVNDLLDHPDYPHRPAQRDLVKIFETPAVQTNDYASRLIGYIHPPVTGEYTFWIASGGYAGLWLGRDENPANKSRIASTFGGLPHEWNPPKPQVQGEFQTPKSPRIRLIAGRRYFIEAVQKTATGPSHLAVAWKVPGGELEVISGENLSPFKPTH